MKTVNELKTFVKNAGRKFLLTKYDHGYFTEKKCVLTGNTQKNSFEFEVLETKFSDSTTSDKKYTSWSTIPSKWQISMNPDGNDFTFHFTNDFSLTFNFYDFGE